METFLGKNNTLKLKEEKEIEYNKYKNCCKCENLYPKKRRDKSCFKHFYYDNEDFYEYYCGNTPDIFNEDEIRYEM